ncbi:hypothetical protein [Streptomyces chiangmaiensis]|uniref:Transposase n=1 Tax=Streptomyces chiangmaiensis TaxID=766497 RepID=A0ABU7FLN7_9ACTN|nr:hypothetical protein [Streptomyces chiangmaiensis]MED7825035.1 hypothetical protein [Streptomyces chiangmaiensis]
MIEHLRNHRQEARQPKNGVEADTPLARRTGRQRLAAQGEQAAVADPGSVFRHHRLNRRLDGLHLPRTPRRREVTRGQLPMGDADERKLAGDRQRVRRSLSGLTLLLLRALKLPSRNPWPAGR